jgi:TatD DNase family protein
VQVFDTHAHLDDPRFAGDLDAVIQRARADGVMETLTVGVDLPTSRRAIDIARRHEGIYAAVGFHAEAAGRITEPDFAAWRALLANPKVVAIGEIGLDYYHRHYPPHDVQQAAFVRQLTVAAEVNLPVVMHNRQATGDFTRILEGFAGRLRGVAHCFSADEKTARLLVEWGFHISIAGPVTYPTAGQLTQIARIVPDDRLLVETDSPYLTPQPERGKRNEPAYVVFTLEKIAALRGVATEKLAELTSNNARGLFLS